MEQTSGLRDVMELKKWKGYQNGDIVTKQDILTIIGQQKRLNFPSGSKFEYNRTGFVLLTEVIEKVSGMSFSSFVKQHIFKPLGMKNSVFVNTHTELIQNRSYSYATTDNKFTKMVNNSSFIGGTNLYTSTSDFTKWMKNLANQSIGKLSFYTYMQTHIELLNGEKSNYTPGIFKSYSDGYWTIHLEGFDHGYTSYMMYVPEHDFSLVFFSNDNNFSIDAAYDAIYTRFNSDYKNAPVKPIAINPVKFISKSAAALQNYAGHYFFEDNFSTREIVLENDTLYYVRGENNRTPMVPIAGNHTFKMLFPGDANVRVTFKQEGEFMEFRNIFGEEGNDYVLHARKFEFYKGKLPVFSGTYKHEELGHIISVQNVNKEIQLTMNGKSITLDQIGEHEFLTKKSPKVKYVKLQRDEQQNIIGVYLSGHLIKDLYYKKL